MQAPCRLLQRSLRTAQSTTAQLPPAFLLPAFCGQQTSSFSTSTPHLARKDGNPSRGVSALRHTGLRKKQSLSVTRIPRTEPRPRKPKGPKIDHTLLDPATRYKQQAEAAVESQHELKLPKPVLDPAKRSKVQVDEDHGLWAFFNKSRTSLPTVDEDDAHGRGWTVPELRAKDWEDLHRLWWVCIKERNRLQTANQERERTKAGYGTFESEEREKEVKKTMKGIKHVLTERWYAWDNARDVAMEDPEVNLSADTMNGEPAYTPMSQIEDDQLAEDNAGRSPPGDLDLPPVMGPRAGGEARV